MKPFIKLEEAIEIVITLASENVLDEDEANLDPEILVPERERQLEAIKTIEDFFTNNVFN